MKAVVAVLFVCSLVHSGYAAVILAPYQEANCTQIEVHGNDLQEALINISLAEPSDACFQVAIAPGNYTISQVLNISQNVALQGVGSDVNVAFNATKPVEYVTSRPYYVMQFLNTSFAAFTNIHFTSSPGIIGFENVTEVRITNCTFSYFTDGAVDIFNCGYPTITNCTFQHNGPASIIKPQVYRGHSAGLSVAFGHSNSLGYNPRVKISGCTFSNNTVDTHTTVLFTTSRAIQSRTFPGRGGGAAILLYAVDSIDAQIDNCVFADNRASSLGGGLYTLPDGVSNHTITISRSVFIRNSCNGAAGGLLIGFIDPGSLTRSHSVLVYDSEFTDNFGAIGGAVFISITGYSPIIQGIVGNYVLFENCIFQRNQAATFGGAIAIYSLIVLDHRERIKPIDISNCLFLDNSAANSGGVVGVAYFAVRLIGRNTFQYNAGTSITSIGSVIRVTDGSLLQFTDNTNSGSGGALYVLSLGLIIIGDGVKIEFSRNIGSFGASVVVEGYIPDLYQRLFNNTLCFIQHESAGVYPQKWKERNISLVFSDNVASVGAAFYLENIHSCSFSNVIQDTGLFFRQDFAVYSGNKNINHKNDVENMKWNVQTPPISLQVIDQSIGAYPGENVRVHISALDQLNNPVSALLRLSNAEGRVSCSSNQLALAKEQYHFQPSLVLYEGLSEEVFDTTVVATDTRGDPGTVLLVTARQTNQVCTNFSTSRQACYPGSILTQQDTLYYSCTCSYAENPVIANCVNSTIMFASEYGSLWGNISNQANKYGDTIVTYSCPMGYCRCHISSGTVGNSACQYSIDYQNIKLQCDCQRSGVLCGDCVEGLGVSALLNRCVSCENYSGVLIAGLILANIIVFTLLLVPTLSFPSWLHPCVFYLQLLPYMTEHFPVTFNAVHHYLYYMSSGLSFYFVYDFCLYPNMSPLVSYFIRYLPLFTAVIICPIILAIRQRIYPHAPWHGLWWIVVLMYTHVVHTSMSILNCPRLPGSDGNTANVWYINGNIQCFTGWHIPLAILAILILILCVAAIPLTWILAEDKVSLIPRWFHNHTHKLTPSLTNGYKDETNWFGAVELSRRMISVVFIVALPGNEHSSLFLIMIFMSVFGTAQPYKNITANILEVAMAADLLIMLLLKNTNGVYDFLQVLPAQTVQATSNATTCTDNDDIVGVTPLVGLLAPLYYIPLLITVVGGVIWAMYTFRFHRKLKHIKHKFSIQYSTKLESYSLPREGSNHIQVTLLSIQDMIDEDSTALATPYARHEIS